MRLRAIAAGFFVPLIFLVAAVSITAEALGRFLTQTAKRIDGPDGLFVRWVDAYIARVEAEVEARRKRVPVATPPRHDRAPLRKTDCSGCGGWDGHHLHSCPLASNGRRTDTGNGPDIRHPRSSVSIRVLHDEHHHEVDDGA